MAAMVMAGMTNILIVGAVTVTFPSNRFCKNYVDQNFIDKVTSIALAGQRVVGGVVLNGQRVSHDHITNIDAVAYVWDNAQALRVVAYGEKGGKGAKVQNSGGYTWET